MHAGIYAATTTRILMQLRTDRRTVGLILVVPIALLTLLYFMYRDRPSPGGVAPFDRIGVTMLAVLPFALMFLITSVAMLRERSSGTLERLLTTPMGKLDLLAGYGTAFSLTAGVQAGLACTVCYLALDLDTAGSPGWVLLIAVLDAVLGVGLGLLCSAFARSEFQAVQFLPVVVIPQLFLCGLFVPRGDLPAVLEWTSNVMPLSYAVEAITQVSAHPGATATMGRDLVVVAACTVAALVLAAATLRRRTP